MADKFQTENVQLVSPASHLATITPDDNTDLPNSTRGINVDSAGVVHLTTVDGDTGTVFVAAGIVFPVRARRVFATGTTATGIKGLW